MIKETGRVVALQGGEVWVEAERESTCSKCSLQSGCGERLIGGALGIGRHRLVLDAGVDTNWSLDDHVEIGIPEVDLLKSAALAYLLPLLFLICGMLVLYRHYGEVGAIVGAIIGMLTGLVFVRALIAFAIVGLEKPRLLRRLPAYGAALPVR